MTPYIRGSVPSACVLKRLGLEPARRNISVVYSSSVLRSFKRYQTNGTPRLISTANTAHVVREPPRQTHWVVLLYLWPASSISTLCSWSYGWDNLACLPSCLIVNATGISTTTASICPNRCQGRSHEINMVSVRHTPRTGPHWTACASAFFIPRPPPACFTRPRRGGQSQPAHPKFGKTTLARPRSTPLLKIARIIGTERQRTARARLGASPSSRHVQSSARTPSWNWRRADMILGGGVCTLLPCQHRVQHKSAIDGGLRLLQVHHDSNTTCTTK